MHIILPNELDLETIRQKHERLKRFRWRRPSEYFDLMPVKPGTNPQPYIGPVQTRLKSTYEEYFMDALGDISRDASLEGAIILNVGGHMGHAIAPRVKASAIVNIDLNPLQGIHHRIYAEDVLAKFDGDMDDYWQRFETMPEILDYIWKEQYEGQPLHMGRIQPKDVYRGNGYSLEDVIANNDVETGMDPAALHYNSGLAKNKRIYSILVDLADQYQMHQACIFVDKIADELGCLKDGARTVPTIMWAANAVDWMQDNSGILSNAPTGAAKDFCGVPTDNMRMRRAKINIDDIVFGFGNYPRNHGLLFSSIASGPWHPLMRHDYPQTKGFLAGEYPSAPSQPARAFKLAVAGGSYAP